MCADEINVLITDSDVCALQKKVNKVAANHLFSLLNADIMSLLKSARLR